MNITKIIGGIVIAGGIGVVATPMFYQKQVNKLISTQKQYLSQKGIDISKKSDNDSFFQVNREYILTIKDITPFIKDVYPNISSYDLKALKKTFDNTQFLVKLNFSKYPVAHKEAAKITLYKLNDYTTRNLSTDFTGNEILNFIKNKGLEIILDTNSLELSKATLKNIDLTLHKSKTSKNIMHLKTLNTYTLFNSKNNSTTNIDNIEFNLVDNHLKSDISIQNFIYNLSKQNDFNYKTTSSIDTIKYNYEKTLYYSNRTIKADFVLKNISSNSNVKSIVNNLSVSNSISIKKADFHADNNSIIVDNFKLTNKFEKLDLISIKKIVDSLKSSPKIDPKELSQYAQTLINKGFKFSIKPLSFDKITINSKKNINISKLDLNFVLNLAQNNFTLNSPINRLLAYLSADLNIKTTKENIDLLTKINPMIAIYLSQIATITKNNVSIDISYKNGRLLSNGKQIR